MTEEPARDRQFGLTPAEGRAGRDVAAAGGEETSFGREDGDRAALRMTNGAGGVIDASRCGLRLDPRLPFDAWKALGARIKVRSDPSSWWLGDWLVFGRQQFGERHREALEATGLDNQTLDGFGIVARRFESSRRRGNLSFQHHADVCEMPDSAQDQWLNLAARNRWPKAEFRIRVRDAARASGSQDAHVLRLGLKVEARRERSWRAAAARAGTRSEDWIGEVLDAAAR